MEEKLNELAQNEEFCKRIAEAGSPGEAVKLFAAEGVEVTAEEVKMMFASIPAGELDEGTLENVSGGCLILWRWWKNRSKTGGYSAGGGGYSRGGGFSSGGSAGGR